MTALRTTRASSWAISVIAIAVACSLPWMFGSGSYQLLELETVMAMIMVCIGLNVVMGFAGQVFLGPSATFAVASFVVAGLALRNGLLANFWVMVLVGALSGAVVGLVVAGPALRMRGFYLGIATVYLAVVVPTIAENLSITGGSTGLSLLADQSFNQSPSGTVLFELGVGGVGLLAALSALFLRARIGQRLNVLGSSEELAATVGIAGYRTKLAAFLIGSAMIGVGSAYFVFTQEYTSGASTSASLSILIIAACVIGGLGRVWGPILGGTIVFAPSIFLGSLDQYQDIVFGIILIVVVVAYPSGIAGVRLHVPEALRLRLGLPPTPTLRRRAGPARATAAPRSSAGTMAKRGESPVPATERLELRAIRRSFRGVPAVDGIDLDVLPGRVHAVIGPNGSGKTTLLNLVSGFLRLDDGTVSLGSTNLENWSPARVAAAGIARTFQTPKLMAGRSTFDNVRIGALRRFHTSDVASLLLLPSSRRAEHALGEHAHARMREVSLDELAQVPVGLLSHGTQRLVEVARALVAKPKFVLLDEPAAGLSPSEVETLKISVRRLTDDGVGILLVEHNLPVVFDLADEVTVLELGKVLFRGTPAEVAASPVVARAYLGEKEEVAAPERAASSDTGTTEGLSVRALRAGYGAMEVVRRVDLDVRPGEFVTLIGRNGVGKTTTLQAIAGLRGPTHSGSVDLDGRSLGGMPAWKVTTAGIALVPEGKRIFGHMTVSDNLRVGLLASPARNRTEEAQRMQRVLELFPLLGPALGRLAGDLSGGGQQMVAVGQALMGQPKILLLDEPASGLAPSVVHLLFGALSRLCADGVGVLVVDQSVERSLEVSDRVYVMDDGVIVLEGRPDELSTDQVIDIIVTGSATDPEAGDGRFSSGAAAPTRGG